MVFKAIKNFGKEKERKIKEKEIVISNYEILKGIIESRRSVRDYKDELVDDDVIKKILESVKHAPSAGNYQPWEMIVVRDKDTKRSIVDAAYGQEWMMEAPVFIVACINDRLAGAVYGGRGRMLYGIQAVACAIQNMFLTAESLGLGTCWVGAFSEVAVARLLECPEYIRPCAIITLGYPVVKSQAPVRQGISEYYHVEKYGQSVLEKKVVKEKKPTYMKFR